jgi:hypothetical protein
MAITRPKSEQLEFRSVHTGQHILDTYLEACEKGEITLPALLDKIFDSNGALNPTALQFRVDETTSFLQARFGNYTDASVGWYNTGQKFFRQLGPYASGVEYGRLDMVEDDSAVYVCILSHTSSGILDTTKWSLIFDGNLILAEIQAFRASSEPRLDLLEESVLLGIDVL